MRTHSSGTSLACQSSKGDHARGDGVGGVYSKPKRREVSAFFGNYYESTPPVKSRNDDGSKDEPSDVEERSNRFKDVSAVGKDSVKVLRQTCAGAKIARQAKKVTCTRLAQDIGGNRERINRHAKYGQGDAGDEHDEFARTSIPVRT